VGGSRGGGGGWLADIIYAKYKPSDRQKQLIKKYVQQTSDSYK